jgi:glycosyltransferase involved in cell wall biosynthesis
MDSSSPDPQVNRVAIIVTCFNSGKTLPETISSIDSCGTPVELVVVDDGSYDPHTLDVLSRFEDRHVRVIRQENRGQADATNAGVAATAAPYVMRFDSDDLLEPGALEALISALDDAPGAAAVWGDFQTFGLTTFLVPGAKELDPWLITYANLVPGSGTLLRRTFLEAAGGWRLATGFEDWDLWMTFCEHGYQGLYIPRLVFRYRRHESSRQALAHSDSARYYMTLLERHQQLVRDRRQNLRQSHAPVAVKVLVSVVQALPLVPLLTKVNTCEFLARFFWSRSARDALEMLRQGLALRRGSS